MKKQNLDFEVTRDFFVLNEIYNSEVFEKHIGTLQFVVLDIDLSLSRYCL